MRVLRYLDNYEYRFLKNVKRRTSYAKSEIYFCLQRSIFLRIFIIQAVNSGLTATAINNRQLFLTTKKAPELPQALLAVY